MKLYEKPKDNKMKANCSYIMTFYINSQQPNHRLVVEQKIVRSEIERVLLMHEVRKAFPGDTTLSYILDEIN